MSIGLNYHHISSKGIIMAVTAGLYPTL